MKSNEIKHKDIRKYPAKTNALTREVQNVLHRRVARIIYGFSRDIPSQDVLKEAKWDSLFFMYKLSLVKLIYKIYNDLAPISMSHTIVKPHNKYNLVLSTIKLVVYHVLINIL